MYRIFFQEVKTNIGNIIILEVKMKTWFENTIDRRPLYCGGSYVFKVRTDCASGTVEFVVYNPFENNRVFDDYEKAKDYYFSLGK